jgi:hypothetical protein
MPRPSRLLTVLATAVFVVAASTGSASAIDGDVGNSGSSNPTASQHDGYVTTQTTGTSPGGGSGSSAGTGDPCTYTRAMIPDPANPAVMIPYDREIGGQMYAIYGRSCPGENWTTSIGIPILSPIELARIARDRVTRLLPATKPGFTGADGPWQYVKVPTIFWVDPTDWEPFTLTATAFGTWSTVTVTPVGIRFTPGDDSPPVTCAGPGKPYEGVRRPQDDYVFRGEPGQCGYLYNRSSKDAPDLKYPAVMAVEWRADWRASDGTSGTLEPIWIATSVGIKVARVRAVGGSAPVTPVVTAVVHGSGG